MNYLSLGRSDWREVLQAYLEKVKVRKPRLKMKTPVISQENVILM